jgi:copper chaperone CopZ
MEQKTNQKNTQPNKSEKGFLKGLLSGLVPHIGCIAFIALTVLGVAGGTAIFSKFLFKAYFLYAMVGLSFALATLSAALYLRRNGILSMAGAKRKWGYLLTLFGTTLVVNLLMFYVVFPSLGSINSFSAGDATTPTGAFIAAPDGSAAAAGAAASSQGKLTLQVDIPCAGHAPLITGELKKLSGITGVKFRSPNYFDVTYDSNTLSEAQILAASIFKDFSARAV